jgi:hypothetical protein
MMRWRVSRCDYKYVFGRFWYLLNSAYGDGHLNGRGSRLRDRQAGSKASARLARVVVPGIPHHVTHRGNRRERIFFAGYDYRRYRGLIGRASPLPPTAPAAR